MPVSVADALKRQHTPAAAKLFAFLNAAPADQLYDTNEILQACDISDTTLRRIGADWDLQPYRTAEGSGILCYWGSKEAIKAYREGKG